MPHEMPIIRVLNLGRMAYTKALDVQNRYVERLSSSVKRHNDKPSPLLKLINHPNVLILVEHYPVYTIGIRTQNYPKSEEERLKSLGADFVSTNRGGLITFHGLGQLVAYPILYLRDFDPDKSVKSYVRKIETTVINMSKEILKDVKPELKVDVVKEYPGVWINDTSKIAAIGIHSKDSITSHGVAINCNTDLKWYDHIVPCGIEGKGITSYSKELKRDFTVGQAVPYFLESFRSVFKCDFINGFDSDDDNIDHVSSILTKVNKR